MTLQAKIHKRFHHTGRMAVRKINQMNRESRARHIGQHFNQTVLLYQALKCLPTLCIELSDGFVHSATDQRDCAG